MSSTIGALFGDPKRVLLNTCGDKLIFSVPPATITFASPKAMDCAPDTIDCKPDPQSRFNVNAEDFSSKPLFKPICRAKYAEFLFV